MLHAVLDKTTSHLMETQHLLMNPKYKELRGKSYTKELRQLAQGMPRVSKGTNTIVFIRRKDIPHYRKHDITYRRVYVNYCPEKEDPNRTRVTVGGNLLHYPGDYGIPAQWLSGRPMLLVAEVRGSIPAKHRGWSRR
jgi:hypothetical protein